MEPGHEDREYPAPDWKAEYDKLPQWSPVMKTGNTSARAIASATDSAASMEPGHEDREYPRAGSGRVHLVPASMEPGHEDREYAHRLVVRAG